MLSGEKNGTFCSLSLSPLQHSKLVARGLNDVSNNRFKRVQVPTFALALSSACNMEIQHVLFRSSLCQLSWPESLFAHFSVENFGRSL